MILEKPTKEMKNTFNVKSTREATPEVHKLEIP